MMRSYIPSSICSSVGTAAFAAGTSALLNASRRCFSRSTTSYTARPVIENSVSSLARRSSFSTSCSSSPRSVLDIATAAAPRLSVCRRFSSTSSSCTTAELKNDLNEAEKCMETLEEAEKYIKTLKSALHDGVMPENRFRNKNLLSEQIEEKLNRWKSSINNKNDSSSSSSSSSTQATDAATTTTTSSNYNWFNTWTGIAFVTAAWLISAPFACVGICCITVAVFCIGDMLCPSEPAVDPYEGMDAEQKQEHKDDVTGKWQDKVALDYYKDYCQRRRRRFWRNLKRLIAELPRYVFLGFVTVCALFQVYLLAAGNAAVIAAAVAIAADHASPQNYIPVVPGSF